MEVINEPYSGYSHDSSPCVDILTSPLGNKERYPPEVTISAFAEIGQAELSIQVPLQRSYTGRKPAIPSSLADTPCAAFGVQGVLDRLNAILGTSQTLDTPSLSALIEEFISNEYDFGTAYGRLHPRWPGHTNPPPRRLWDLYSNRVVPCWVTKEQWPRPISHAWVDEKHRVDIWTPINGHEWPVPIPDDADLNLIRIEMLNLGIEYTWLDVLCLRQKGEEREDLRAEEWKVDVPTIGCLYRVAGVVVWYLSGLGRPFRLEADDLESDHWWFNRVWTLQEVGEDRIIAGDTPDGPLHALIDEEGNYREEIVAKFREQLQAVDDISPDSYNIFDVLAEMQKRVSTNPVDKVAGLAFRLDSATIPAYYENQSLEDAWTALVNTIIPWFRGDLFFGFPEQGTRHKKWRPSWNQVMEKPRQEGECGAWVSRDEETGNDWCWGCCIEKGTVRGLALEGMEGVDRRSELTVEDGDGKAHAFQITAAHRYLIPEKTYTIIGAPMALENWVVGVGLPNNWFEKVSVFTIPNPEERQRLKDLKVTAKRSHNYLV
ncbi:uncharacterized protein ARMOST_12181 [Armillaria ostoyae]|uniref:Heterokaryon incompatibility domain-containing protein n=1 Tax=Armillaria ostoyae TaxID=47428 RepID=A0A284RJ69_ARMOS|nr:uncharacterized protein ARMOST_12181 [Armillaria ostoyae]